MRIVYLDCFSGISGDMTLAALVDAGADRDYVESGLARIRAEPFRLVWRRVTKNGVSALKVDVELEPGRAPAHHRHFADIVRLIEQAELGARATETAVAIFRRLAEAEARIHRVPVERVHFHEVGAIDSIADIVGVALALDSLAPDRVLVSPVPVGTGFVRCDHGVYPVPAPATLELLKGLPIADTPPDAEGELTTPTGAAIVAAVAHGFSRSLPAMTAEAVGYGAGARDLPGRPNVLRAVVGRAEEPRD